MVRSIADPSAVLQMYNQLMDNFADFVGVSSLFESGCWQCTDSAFFMCFIT